MRLVEIAEGRAAWASVSMQRMPARLAYNVMRYATKVEAEGKRLEKQRVALVRQIAGVGPDEAVSLADGSDEKKAFIKEWSEVLELESDLPQCDRFTLTELIDAMEAKKEEMAPDILAGIFPFFPTEDAEVHSLKAVK